MVVSVFGIDTVLVDVRDTVPVLTVRNEVVVVVTDVVPMYDVETEVFVTLLVTDTVDTNVVLVNIDVVDVYWTSTM